MSTLVTWVELPVQDPHPLGRRGRHFAATRFGHVVVEGSAHVQGSEWVAYVRIEAEAAEGMPAIEEVHHARGRGKRPPLAEYDEGLELALAYADDRIAALLAVYGVRP